MKKEVITMAIPMSTALTAEQCAVIRTFLRALVTFAQYTPTPDVNRFLQEYRDITTNYHKKGGPKVPLVVGECAWVECGNKFEYHRYMHQRYCSRACARLAALARQRERRKAMQEPQDAHSGELIG